MHKRGLCRRMVSVCLPVRLSVTFVYSVETNKRNFISSPSDSHTILVFDTKRYGSIPTAASLTGAKIAMFDQ